MGSSSITTDAAYAICYWVDQGASGSPPQGWTAVFTPAQTLGDPNFAVLLQDSGNPSQYALAIQGTKSIWDALLDFKIDTTVAFPLVANANIAHGALEGLNNVLRLKDSSRKSLEETLKKIGESSSLLVTGHSLGGTLAALMAVWAAKHLFKQKQPVEQLPAEIQTITFAAFAAGDQNLADFLNSQSNYQANFNANDAIPHVWATSGQYSVDNMYQLFPSPGPSPMPPSLQSKIQNKINGIPAGFSYVQTNGKSFSFTSSAATSWLSELSYQHNDAYNTQFNAPDSGSSEDDALTDGLSRSVQSGNGD